MYSSIIETEKREELDSDMFGEIKEVNYTLNSLPIELNELKYKAEKMGLLILLLISHVRNVGIMEFR